MARLKEKLKSCGQETFPIANKNNRSIPAHTWANDNTVLLETKKKQVGFFSFFCPYSSHHSGILGHGKHGCGLWKPSHSNYPPFPHKHANQPWLWKTWTFTLQSTSLHYRFLPVISKYICQNKCLQTHTLLPVSKGITVCSTRIICALV